MKDIDILFTPFKIGCLEIKNRFVRSSTHYNISQNGFPSAKGIEVYNELAQNNIGLIITGAATVSKTDGYCHIYNDKFIAPWKDITHSVKNKGTKIAIQIQHPSVQSHLNRNRSCSPDSISASNIYKIINDFAQACRRAKLAGFDAVQLHLAHGYLLSRFISPLYNNRNDRFGESTLNRTRIVLNIIRKAKELIGNDYPIFVKQNFSDYENNGLELEEAVQVAVLLEKAGITAIETSAGTAANYEISSLQKVKSEADEAYFKSFAIELKKHVSIPVILTGGIRSYRTALNAVNQNKADFIGLSRPLICEPNLITRWKNDNRNKSKCISCNSCLKQLGDCSKPVHCILK